MGAVSVNRLVN